MKSKQPANRITAMALAILMLFSVWSYPAYAEGAGEEAQSSAQESAGDNGDREPDDPTGEETDPDEDPGETTDADGDEDPDAEGDGESAGPELTLGASGITFTIPEDEYGTTDLYLPAGEPVTVTEVDGLDRDDPQPRLEEGLPAPYIITGGAVETTGNSGTGIGGDESLIGDNDGGWDGVETKEYSVHKGSVIIRFYQDFIDQQAPGEHTVRVEFLNHTGETALTLSGTQGAGAAADGGTVESDTHNPQTGDFGASPWHWFRRRFWPSSHLRFCGGAYQLQDDKIYTVRDNK